MGLTFNTTCNATLDEMRIGPEDEIPIVGPLRFHDLALIIASASTLVAVSLSFFLIFMHATHYTKPNEQRHIIRILFMVPVYSLTSLLSLRYYWHAIYFTIISECYEAFAISAFFALMCHYIAPDLHEQKKFFQALTPIKPWVWPLDWFRACCCGQRGPWRTPANGLTWFNIIWIGIYHYIVIRVLCTITAVVTHYFHKYCESSNSPVFAHIWVLVIVFIAVGIAMYCLIQFYVQLKDELAQHRPFLKICAIKLVVFLSFWQSAAISVATAQLEIVKANEIIAYPDLKVGIPSLLLCFEMALFAILHIWAFPYAPYRVGAKPTFYPVPDPSSGEAPKQNLQSPPSGGFLGLAALWDALNMWDFIKAFGRGIRWLFVGVKQRGNGGSYGGHRQKGSSTSSGDFDLGNLAKSRNGFTSTDHLPIANEFRRSKFMFGGGGNGSSNNTTGNGSRNLTRTRLSPVPQSPLSVNRPAIIEEEDSGLIANAAEPGRRSVPEPPSPYRDHYLGDHPNNSMSGFPFPPGASDNQPQPQDEMVYSQPFTPTRNFSRGGSQAPSGRVLLGQQR
ncbi:hypothetical protein MCOR25_000671 [Pyricularia grisea]|uniref:Uncharacterized protein n=1 Tax=Pyricularia grisea TaxID=148305 RepID=A0A6P8BBZ0_PYRGI|nr:uncharacterized protein PgNI_04044 [Pyricularia grisea]KAI6382371.1 hypothetical protein MCOR25_000671 [Pyricularia grisea]TLD13371.1 hypothetical protein PgNI_04044 [Pyricularia grisea]